MSHSIPHVLGTRPSAGLLTSNPVHMQEASLTKYSHAKNCQQTQLCLFSKEKKEKQQRIKCFQCLTQLWKIRLWKRRLSRARKKSTKNKQPTIKMWFQNLKHSILREKEKWCNPRELKDLIYRQVAFVFQIKWTFSAITQKKEPS